jgi:lipoprotein-anchoring transpeptidase ErfK/SrfK
MNPNQTAAFKTLEQAQQVLKSGDKDTARQLAELAAQLAPDLEEVWLLMAALATPQESVAHLQKALLINPQSERAIKGMAWAKNRLSQSANAYVVAANIPPAVLPEQQEPVQSVAAPAVETVNQVVEETPPATENIQTSAAQPELPGSNTQPHKVVQLEPAVTPEPVEESQDTRRKNALALPRYSYIALLGVFICLVVAFLAWQGAQPVAAFFSSPLFTGQTHGPAWAPVTIARSASSQDPNSAIPTPAKTEIAPTDMAPTDTASTEVPATPTENPAVALVLPSDTPVSITATQQAAVILPTSTPIPPMPTPAPTDAPPPTSIPATVAVVAAATAEVASANASPTPLPTDTGVPFATPKPLVSGGVASAPGTGHWIDVDLTNQRVYAYDGNSVVNSFLVSTGTWAHPTVTGQYYVYIKYRYTDMSGPGYYLPNVPFTMYFYQGYALHGTYWHSNFGTPMSHGCVNLSIPDSEWLFNFSSVGTLVNVHY